MKNKQYRLDIIPGAVISLFAIWYMSMIPGIQTFTGLGSTPLTNHAVPYLWGAAMLILGLWVLVRGFRRKKRFLEEGGVIEKTSIIDVLKDKREVVASFVSMAIYVGIMNSVGFVISTTLYTFVQILILTPKDKWKKNLIPAAVTAVITGCLLFYIFRALLNVLLPVGVFGLGLS